MIHVHACINQNPCGSTKEYITGIPYLNYVSGGVVHQVSAVYYVYSIVGKKDIVKGQSLMGIATAGICPMLANFIGGWMIEAVPLKMILLIGIIIQSAAMIICWIATDQNRFKEDYQG